ncbi:MAG: parallel beta-helix repeat protein [Patescibacteria group bacterium]|jgi:parallel beta-helix repeat protein
MKRRNKNITFIFLSLIIFVSLLSFTSTIPGNSCGNSIASDATFSDNINCSGSSTNGFDITGDNLVVDCGGYLLNGTGGTGAYGINITGRSGVTIQNCNVQNFSMGIYVKDSTNITIKNFINKENLYNGIFFLNVTNSLITNGSILENNFNENYEQGGIVLKSGSDNVVISSITSYGNYYHGIYAQDSNNLLINSSNITNQTSEGIGIYLDISDFVTIQDTNITKNQGDGIQVDNSKGLQVLRNNVSSNGGDGLNFDGSIYSNILLQDNHISYNQNNGIDIDGDHYNDAILCNASSGNFTWYSNYVNNQDTSLIREINLTEAANASFDYYLWYDIQGYSDKLTVYVNNSEVEVHNDYWEHPWQKFTINLTNYTGMVVYVNFTFTTDGGVTETGFYLDDFETFINGTSVFSDNVESGENDWVVNTINGSSWEIDEPSCSEQGTIENNYLSNNGYDINPWNRYDSILLRYIANYTIQGNTVINATYNGISLEYSDFNLIFNNTVIGSDHYGLKMAESSDDNNVSHNIFINNSDVGIRNTGRRSLIEYNTIQGDGTFIGKDVGDNSFEDNRAIYLTNDNNILRYNNISGYYYGLYLKSLDGFTSNGNKIFNNLYGTYLDRAGETDDLISFINTKIYNNDHGMYALGGSNIKILNTDFTNNSGDLEFTGLYASADSRINITNGNFIDNGEWVGEVYWTINESVQCINNNITIRTEGVGINITGQGSLETINCTIFIDGNAGIVLDRFTSDLQQEQIITNTAQEFEIPKANVNLTLFLSSGGSSTINVETSTVTSTGTTSALSPFKGVNIEVDANTSSSLTWAIIKIFYNESEVAAANIEESTLKLYYYNETSSDWELEPIQGVETTLNYIWANVSHFSLFGSFGSFGGSSDPSTSSGGGGGGYCIKGYSRIDGLCVKDAVIDEAPVSITNTLKETQNQPEPTIEEDEINTLITGNVIFGEYGPLNVKNLIIFLIIVALIIVAVVVYRRQNP